jgi:putative PIN family toxin of toxin-antitoxin system
MRVMCDTNVLISGVLFPNSVPGKVLYTVAEQERLVLATYVVEELYRVFQKKFPDKAEHLDRYPGSGEFELFVTPGEFQHVEMPPVRDSKDEAVLASAILAEVDVLITGDKDFSVIDIDRPIILTPASFLNLSKRI